MFIIRNPTILIEAKYRVVPSKLLMNYYFVEALTERNNAGTLRKAALMNRF